MKQDKRPFLIALTGGIASGKTAVSKWFAQKGFVVFSADEIGHQVLRNETIITAVTAIFGNSILVKNQINRKILGKMVFADFTKLQRLNEIIHPFIFNEMQKIIDNCKEKYLVFEVPLLFENGLEKCFDLTINVFSKKSLRIERLKKRDNLSEKEILAKMETQLPDYLKIEKADISVENNSTLDKIYGTLEKIYEYLPRFSKKKIQRMTEKK